MSRKKLTMLTTTKAVVNAIGGGHEDETKVQVIARMTGRNYSAAFNWTKQYTFPSNTYVVMKAALEAKGYDAPDSLWGMTPAEIAEA